MHRIMWPPRQSNSRVVLPLVQREHHTTISYFPTLLIPCPPPSCFLSCRFWTFRWNGIKLSLGLFWLTSFTLSFYGLSVSPDNMVSLVFLAILYSTLHFPLTSLPTDRSYGYLPSLTRANKQALHEHPCTRLCVGMCFHSTQGLVSC